MTPPLHNPVNCDLLNLAKVLSYYSCTIIRLHIIDNCYAVVKESPLRQSFVCCLIDELKHSSVGMDDDGLSYVMVFGFGQVASQDGLLFVFVPLPVIVFVWKRRLRCPLRHACRFGFPHGSPNRS